MGREGNPIALILETTRCISETNSICFITPTIETVIAEDGNDILIEQGQLTA